MDYLEVNQTDVKETKYDPEVKYYCAKCEKETFPKYRRDLDYFKFLFFMFFILASFFLLLIIMLVLLLRKLNKNQTKLDTKSKAREELNFMGLIVPQTKIIICIECNKVIKEENDSGDSILVFALFVFIILLFFVLRYIYIS